MNSSGFPKQRAAVFRARTRLLTFLAPVLLCAGALSCCGAGVLGMQIESVTFEHGTNAVLTTGARFVFDDAQGAICCYQRLPTWRPVATITGLGLRGLRVLSHDDWQCVLGDSSGRPRLTVGGDSLLILSLTNGAEVGFRGSYVPAYHGKQGNNLFLQDATGGVAAYLVGKGTCSTPASWAPDSDARLFFSVFPPRPYDREHARQTMLHSFSWKHPYPTDAELKDWRRFGSILTLHSWIWQGTTGQTMEKDNSWGTTAFVPRDALELQRVLGTAHRLGIEVVPYMSPYYFGDAAGGVGHSKIEPYLDKVKAIVERYHFDGVYLDGLYKDDVEGSYDLVRRVRELIGDTGILHIHTTGIPLEVPCPFIDTYATYTLTGEHHRVLTGDYARWLVSKYNLGNCVGTFCYDSTRPSAEVIERLLAANARMPYWVSDGTWSGLNYYLSAPEKQLLEQLYFPKLNATQQP